jgi:hypothetical protein
MLSTTTRLVVGAIGALMTVVGLGMIASGAGIPGIAGSGLWLTIIGAVVVVAVVLERQRYRSEAADRTFDPVGPGGGEPPGSIEPRFRPTDELFVDPTTGHRMRVHLDPRTGERRYVAEQ